MLDVLVITAHPDDEFVVSGIMIKAKKEGKSVGLICHTTGESGGFATGGTRVKELAGCVKYMKLDYFKQLNYPDAGVEVNTETVDNLVGLLRETKPQVILTLHEKDYHPDHVAVSRIVDRAVFIGGLKREGDKGTWHPKQVLYFGLDHRTNPRRPDIIFDIGDVIGEKQTAADFHVSQGVGPHVQAIARNMGNLGGFKFGEGLFIKQPLRLNDVNALFSENKIGR